MLRFCRIIETGGNQFLLRAANQTALVGMNLPEAPVTILTVDTTVSLPDGSDWYNLRAALHMPNQEALHQALECFTKSHARETYRLLEGRYYSTLTIPEVEEGLKKLGESLVETIVMKYGGLG
jgi:hypothetical protein